MMTNTLQAAPAALPAAPQGKNHEGESDAVKDGREGDASDKIQHSRGAAILRHHPKAEVEGGAGGASGATGKERQGDVEIDVNQSSWSIEEEKKRLLCFPPIDSFSTSAVYIDGDAAAVQ